MNQPQASTFEVYVCPIGHKDLCLQKWKNKFIDHWIICKCHCHSYKGDLDESQENEFEVGGFD